MAKSPLKPPYVPENNRPLTEEELRVWEAVTESDERLPHARVDWDSVLDAIEPDFIAPFDAAPVIHRPTTDQLEKLLGTPAGLKPRKNVPLAPVGIDHNTARRLRRGKLPVEAILDLHGHGQEEAKQLLGGFITASHARQRRVVLVITGKGRLSKESGGVLRRALPKWLALPPCDRLVLSFTTARQEDGGEGAFYVLLRRQKVLL